MQSKLLRLQSKLRSNMRRMAIGAAPDKSGILPPPDCSLQRVRFGSQKAARSAANNLIAAGWAKALPADGAHGLVRWGPGGERTEYLLVLKPKAELVANTNHLLGEEVRWPQ